MSKPARDLKLEWVLTRCGCTGGGPLGFRKCVRWVPVVSPLLPLVLPVLPVLLVLVLVLVMVLVLVLMLLLLLLVLLLVLPCSSTRWISLVIASNGR